jgi:hypothetical protein
LLYELLDEMAQAKFFGVDLGHQATFRRWFANFGIEGH